MATKDTYYFPHDHNARSNKHIKKLLYKHGMLGYGIWWALVEDLYNNANALPLDYESIAHDLRVDIDVVKNVINDFELFQVENEKFSSDNVQRRIDERNGKSIKAQQSAQKRWSNSERNANALPSQSEPNAIKEIKGKEKKVFTAPTALEVQDYFFNNGYSRESGAKAYEYYRTANWKDSRGKQVKNWKQKMQGNWFKDEYKIQKRGLVL